MAVRLNLIDEAGRRARRQLDDAIRELRSARIAAGIRQQAVATALGVSRPLVSLWERGIIVPDQIQLARWGAAVGRDVRLAVYVAGSPLRDAGHLRLFSRARAGLTGPWSWRTEVRVSSDPLDRRAIDVVLVRGRIRIGFELITRLIDAQAQVRQANLKQEASGVDRMILVLADTAHNREAVRAAAPYLESSFRLRGRPVLAALRAGQIPAANGLVLI
jgi:DNA-binding XRE family transcriptional regulator